MPSPPQPKRPTHIPDYAEVCLAALVAHGLGDKLSLGGAFALLHYLDYRATYDVYAVCQAELATPQTCWQLWQRRQTLMGNEPDRERAYLAVATHLTRIERQRPLVHIPNGTERQQAESVRKWFKEELINADLA